MVLKPGTVIRRSLRDIVLSISCKALDFTEAGVVNRLAIEGNVSTLAVGGIHKRRQVDELSSL